MTTRDISFPHGQPLIDRPETPPSPAAAPKSKKEFAAVVEQAMHRRPSSSRPARPSSTQREDPTSPARTKVIRLQKPETNKPASKDQPAFVGPTAKTSAPGAGDGNDSSACSTEDDAPASSKDVAPVQNPSDEGALPDGVPQNIVLFPAPSVIIPFPLAEAKAMGSSTRAVEGSLLSEAAGDTGNDEVPMPAPAPAGKAERETRNTGFPAPRSPLRVLSEGVDIAKLGLAPVEEPERPENVYPVDFPKAAPDDIASRSDPAIISVSFRPSQSAQRADPTATEGRQMVPQLPGQPGTAEESAPMVASTAPAVEARPKRLSPTKAPVRAELQGSQPRSARAAEATGISAARQESRMESITSSKQPDVFSGREPGSLQESPVGAAEPLRAGGETLNSSARNLGATEWQTGRLVSGSDSPASDSLNTRPVDTSGTVERISKLVLGEAALIKQHSSESMAVVLRPDAETELFVHLTQRNGQIEATVRCERGDLQHLGALWGQLQESLAQQKVRLAPLQESPSNHSNFNQSAGSDTNGNGHGSPRRSPDKQSMDEWPMPASSGTDPAHVRGRGGSRHRRLTTSRPGWETWA
jgi:hypothetical protein